MCVRARVCVCVSLALAFSPTHSLSLSRSLALSLSRALSLSHTYTHTDSLSLSLSLSLSPSRTPFQTNSRLPSVRKTKTNKTGNGTVGVLMLKEDATVAERQSLVTSGDYLFAGLDLGMYVCVCACILSVCLSVCLPVCLCGYKTPPPHPRAQINRPSKKLFWQFAGFISRSQWRLHC